MGRGESKVQRHERYMRKKLGGMSQLEAFKENARQFNEALEEARKRNAAVVEFTDITGKTFKRYWDGARYSDVKPSGALRSGTSGTYKASFTVPKSDNVSKNTVALNVTMSDGTPVRYEKRGNKVYGSIKGETPREMPLSLTESANRAKSSGAKVETLTKTQLEKLHREYWDERNKRPDYELGIGTEWGTRGRGKVIRVRRGRSVAR